MIVRMLLALGVLGSGGLWLVGSAMTGATNRQVPDAAPPGHELRIDSSDGVTIAASYWQARKEAAPAILLIHGNGGNRQDMAQTAEWLFANGFSVLSIDLRGHGESTSAEKSFGLYEARDAHAAFNWLKQRDPKSKVGVIGFSLGGAASLIGDDGPLEPDSLVLMSVFPDIRSAIFNRVQAHAGTVLAWMIEPLLSYQSLPRYGVWPADIAPLAAVSKVHAPIMAVSGGRDAYTPPAETEAFFNAAPKGSELWILNELGHDDVVSTSDPEFRRRLLAFLQRTLVN